MFSILRRPAPLRPSPATRGRRRPPCRRPWRFGPRPEPLEARALLATDVWTGGGMTTNWSDHGNWSLGVPPGASDTATFSNGAASASSMVDMPFTIAVLSVDNTWRGTITDDSQLTISSLNPISQVYGTFVMSANSTMDAEFDNRGDFYMSAGSTLENSVPFNYSNFYLTGNGTKAFSGVFYNFGHVKQSGAGDLALGSQTFLLNEPQATYDMTSDGGITQPATDFFIYNHGVFEKTGGTGTSAVTPNFQNYGKVQVSSGTLSLEGAILQVQGGDLTGGNWTVLSTPHKSATLDIASAPAISTIGSKAIVVLKGPNSSFPQLGALTENDGSLSLYNGESFSTAGDFTNNGKLIIGNGGSLSVTGGFTQTAHGVLQVRLTGAGAASPITTGPSGSVVLAGNFKLTATAAFGVGLSVTIVDDHGSTGVSGTFAGLPEGATFTAGGMTFRITYHGGDGNDVVVTRIA